MKALVLSAAATLLLMPQALQAQEWQETRSMHGRFKVQLPGRARYAKQNINTAIGMIELHRFTVQAGGGTFVYMVLYSDYSEEYVKKTGAKEILLDTQKHSNGPLQDVQTKGAKEITLGEHPGREFHLTGSGDSGTVHCSWRHFLVKNRLYQVGVLGLEQELDEATRKKYFESFHLLEEKE